MDTTKPAPTGDEKFVPIDDVAAHLSLTRMTIRRWVREGFIPKRCYIKVGPTYRFDLPAVIAALKGDTPADNINMFAPHQLDLFDNNDDA